MRLTCPCEHFLGDRLRLPTVNAGETCLAIQSRYGLPLTAITPALHSLPLQFFSLAGKLLSYSFIALVVCFYRPELFN